MFTGIICAVGSVQSITNSNQGKRLQITCQDFDFSSVELGDSIAINGVCLTATKLDAQSFWADVSHTTLKVSTLGNLQTGSKVNLEPALTLNGKLGGHLVAGHVDAIGKIIKLQKNADSCLLTIRTPQNLAKYLAAKGSITVDGVSLTLAEVQNTDFQITIINHTLQNTIIHTYQIGTLVNLEVDIIARYLEKLLTSGSQLNKPFLNQHGFI